MDEPASNDTLNFMNPASPHYMDATLGAFKGLGRIDFHDRDDATADDIHPFVGLAAIAIALGGLFYLTVLL